MMPMSYIVGSTRPSAVSPTPTRKTVTAAITAMPPIRAARRPTPGRSGIQRAHARTTHSRRPAELSRL